MVKVGDGLGKMAISMSAERQTFSRYHRADFISLHKGNW